MQYRSFSSRSWPMMEVLSTKCWRCSKMVAWRHNGIIGEMLSMHPQIWSPNEYFLYLIK